MTSFVLTATEPMLSALVRSCKSLALDGDVVPATSLGTSALAAATSPLCAVFVANPSTSWSLQRIGRTVRERSDDATIAVAYVSPDAMADIAAVDGVATRWIASTPFVVSPDPLGWSRLHETRGFDPAITAPAQARAFVRSVIGDWHRPELIETAVLVTSELMTNAVLHARRGPIEVTVACAESNDRDVHLVVADRAPDRLPIGRRPTAQSRGGRGLRIVDASTSRWGVTVTATHKRVWCELSPIGVGGTTRSGGDIERADR